MFTFGQVVFIALFCVVSGFAICYLFWYLPADIASNRLTKEEKRNRILLKMYMGHRL